MCAHCGREHHEHPMIVVTAFVACGKRLLWVRRAIEPKRGRWAIPGGYLEGGETLQEGAARELYEEAGVLVPAEDFQLYMLGTLTFINQIYAGFRAEVTSIDARPGRESLECAFFSRDECPWTEVAYPEVNESVEQAYADLDRGEFREWHVEMTLDRYDRQPVRTERPGPR
jgi:ADP-ribose pyrophosphatase YjhB (NUDIX family)